MLQFPLIFNAVIHSITKCPSLHHMPEKYRNRFFSIVLWSLISAAFIGPGTLTTASVAGALHGLSLLWALIFATVACIVLQEAAARASLITGRSLGEAIAHKMGNTTLKSLIAGVIILGCAAYQAGNILGATLGLQLVWDIGKGPMTLFVCFFAALLLALGSYKGIAKVMSITVALMGLVFVYTAFQADISFTDLFRSAVYPQLPQNSEWIALGLIGTTIVPYNLFLGSGLSRGQHLQDMRFGLTIALGFGGLVSMAILITGTMMAGRADFIGLSENLQQHIGPLARPLLATGLFAAGFSSSITAPLAAAMTARSLFPKPSGELWHHRSGPYVLVWSGVLLTGLLFGMLEVKPIPMIILAQTLNGLLLPVVSILVLWIVNDQKAITKGKLNGPISNALLLIIVSVTIFLGLNNIAKAMAKVLGIALPGTPVMLTALGTCTLIMTIIVLWKTIRLRQT